MRQFLLESSGTLQDTLQVPCRELNYITSLPAESSAMLQVTWYRIHDELQLSHSVESSAGVIIQATFLVHACNISSQL